MSLGPVSNTTLTLLLPDTPRFSETSTRNFSDYEMKYTELQEQIQSESDLDEQIWGHGEYALGRLR